MRVSLCLLLACAGIAKASEEWADTPLLTMLWQATNNGDDAAIDRLLDSSSAAVQFRAADGRGMAWWGFEFQNVYALASIIANGGDIESEDGDKDGLSAKSMCKSPSCDLGSLISKAKSLVPEVKRRAEERLAAAAEEFDDEEDELGEDEIGDDEFEVPIIDVADLLES
eukprot:CAMPEP_0178403752 /NCGR_PEP_ID=MMETSP0689_2-20121128/17531_1 /TAXON_ID=160604 /ORGANISM="Amphidinium massartii, Strain CS-259" /LENGTH=168 /DNA_ID=CAMNT_0020024717 /DNA_START=74 /DNA_END=584 /DNA_ORIENTATION=-